MIVKFLKLLLLTLISSSLILFVILLLTNSINITYGIFWKLICFNSLIISLSLIFWMKLFTVKKIDDKKIKTENSAEKYRREFLGNVSHELKTPIFNIQGYVETLISGALYDSSVNKKYLKRTSKSVDRLIYIIRDLESIGQLESDELSLEFSNWKLKPLIDEIIEQFEIKANKKKIKLLHDKKSTNFHVKGDKDKMSQVLSNLISNSIKYGKRGGVTKISCHQTKETCVVSVKDDGIGIAEKNIKRLFERFYRVDKSRSRDQGGTGLGLAIVKHILEAHNQTINVKSTVNKGTEFSFSIDCSSCNKK